MLAAHQPATEPATAPNATGPSIAERIATVIRRHGGAEASVSRRDFRRAAETCDLSDDELEAHIGAAAKIVAATVDPLADYDVERRINRAVTVLRALLPDAPAMRATLQRNGFSSVEIAALWPRLMPRLAEHQRAVTLQRVA